MDTLSTENQIKNLDEHQKKLLALPSDVLDWMYSAEVSQNNANIAKKFNLGSDKNPIIAKLTGRVALKEITLDALPQLLQENLKVDQETARQIALEIALKQLLVIRGYLKGVENFILKLGGTIPAKIPDISSTIGSARPPAAQPIPTAIITKPFRLAVQENKEILNQQLTADPIKIVEFDQPVRPTIKNWLADYIKQKGAGHHDELERSDYLFKGANALNLPAEERIKLAKILRAYDEDTEVPIESNTKLIDLIELIRKETPRQIPTPRPAAPNPPPKQQIPIPPPPVQTKDRASLQPPDESVAPQFIPAQPQSAAPTPPPHPTDPDTYREKVSDQDLTGPIKPIARPVPKLDGNIIDLKNLDE